MEQRLSSIAIVGEPDDAQACNAWLTRRLAASLAGTHITAPTVLVNSLDITPDILFVCGKPNAGPFWSTLSKHMGANGAGLSEAPLGVFTVWMQTTVSIPLGEAGKTTLKFDARLRATGDQWDPAADIRLPPYLRQLEKRLSEPNPTDLRSLIPADDPEAARLLAQLPSGDQVSAGQLGEVVGQVQQAVWMRLLERWAFCGRFQSAARIVERAKLLRLSGLFDKALNELGLILPPESLDKPKELSQIQVAALAELVDTRLEMATPDDLAFARSMVTRMVRAGGAGSEPAWLTKFAATFGYDSPLARIDERGGGALHPVAQIPMKIVNLDRRPDRWLAFKRQVDQFNNLARFPLDVERFPAVDGLKLKQNPDTIPAVFRPTNFKPTEKQKQAPKQLPFGAIGCFLSEINICRRLAAQGKAAKEAEGDEKRGAEHKGRSRWWFIGEDDAIFGPMFMRDWSMLERLLPDLADSVDIIWIGTHLPPQARLQAMMNTAPRRFVRSADLEVQRLIGGTFGYLVSERGAQRLVDLYDQEKGMIAIGIDSWLYRSPADGPAAIKQLTLDPSTVFSTYLIQTDASTHDSDCAT